MEGQMMNNWKRLLPKVKCPLCENDLKKLRIKGEGFCEITLAWVCDYGEFKRLETLANKKNKKERIMAIPKSFTDEYLKKAEGCTFCGQKIIELTRDELIAMAVAGWEKETEARAEGIRMVKFMRDIRRK